MAPDQPRLGASVMTHIYRRGRNHTSPGILQPAEPIRLLKIFGIVYLTNQPHRASKKPRAREKLSLHPLSLEEALRGAMETGPPPESSRKRCKAKRSAARPKGESKEA